MERRTLEGGIPVLVSSSLADRDVLVAFTERNGGTSDGPYRSLNLGFRTGDRIERVRENRRRAARALAVPGFASADQVHGGRVARVGTGRAGAGFDDPGESLRGVDALVVTRPMLPVAILAADCVPLALASRGRLAVVHAGWRGLAAGVVQRALAQFSAASEVVAAIGPAIGPCHYEVGDEVVAAVHAGAGTAAAGSGGGRRPRLDLATTVARILGSAGVRTIDGAEVCTFCEEDRFFSHRRDGARTGRQALIAARL